MLEFLSHPSFLPALIGFLGGILLTFFFLAPRLSALRLATLKQEKSAANTIAELKTEQSALQTEIASLRSSESRLIKRHGELEALSSSSKERQETVVDHLKQSEATLHEKFNKLENSLLNAIRKSQGPLSTEDFVPHIPAQHETPREEHFEGFVTEQSQVKAESAANVLRAALENPKS